MPYKQSEAAAAASAAVVVLRVAVSETQRLIYDCCGAAGLFLSQLRCAAAYLRLCLQLMDDWSGPPTAPGWEGEGGRWGRGERAAAPQWLNTSLQTRDAPPDQKTPQADETQRPLLQAVDYFRVKMSCFISAGVGGGSVCYTQRFSVNSAFITIMVQCQQCFLGLFRN